MKLDTFLKKIKQVEEEHGGYGIQEFFDKSYEGSCPCFDGTRTINGKKIKVWGRCWRVSDNAQDLNVYGEMDKKEVRQIAEAVKKCLDAQKWHNPYTIIIHNKPWD